MDNTIQLTQNRVFKTGLRIKDGTGYYYLTEGEQLLFGIKQSAYQTDYLLYKTLTADDYEEASDSYVLTLTTEETNREAGRYYYDVALLTHDGELEKIIGCTPLEIVKSIVRSESVC